MSDAPPGGRLLKISQKAKATIELRKQPYPG
jgi:hypothetical protein